MIKCRAHTQRWHHSQALFYYDHRHHFDNWLYYFFLISGCFHNVLATRGQHCISRLPLPLSVKHQRIHDFKIVWTPLVRIWPVVMTTPHNKRKKEKKKNLSPAVLFPSRAFGGASLLNICSLSSRRVSSVECQCGPKGIGARQWGHSHIVPSSSSLLSPLQMCSRLFRKGPSGW